MKATSRPAAPTASTHRPRGFWAGVRGMCLPLALFLMALPSLIGQTRTAPHVRTRSDSEPLITWDNLWMLPVGYIALCVLLLSALAWQAWRRNR